MTILARVVSYTAPLKAWIAPALALIAAIAGALFYRKKAQLETERREASEAARDVERKATDAAMEGERRIYEANTVPIDTTRRDHFERP